ncbi:DivIVA domain-containing protein [Arsenicicoccus cauae]|uniref:DivIVA domain-containing protein n=1 Tax=Arsenicicoccus cauae TaxID=2663847 RepID=UPI0028970499|nr:DivIVA domain-containing protein [Arsenicicoccus cauae]
MPLLTIVLTVLVVGLLTAALVWAVGARPGSLSDQALADPTSGSPYAGLPDGPVATDTVRGLRFDQVLRGYRMDQVDAVLDRLVDELRARDHEIDRLRAEPAWRGDGRGAPVDPATHPDVTAGPLAVSEIVRPTAGASLWTRRDPDAGTRPAREPDRPS